jgi:Outer membrane lipoprotein carrier protein LolA-like
MKRRALGLGLLALSAVAARGAGDGDGLDELMHLLAGRQHGQASFVEQHFLALLKRPVESFGELTYDAPDRLEKRTVEPRPESMLLVGDVLTIRRGSHSRVLDLKSYPQVLPFVESIRATLAGDRGALERVFRVDYAGDLARWALILKPRDVKLAKTVAQVRIDGSQDKLLTVEIRETDGDRSLMTLREHPSP